MTSFLQEYIQKVLKKDIDDRDYGKLEQVYRVLESSLLSTAHVPVVSSVAIGASLCSFRARLVEAIGALADDYTRDYSIKDRVVGVGRKLHNVLALATLNFYDVYKSIVEEKGTYDFSYADFKNIEECIFDAVDELSREFDTIFTEEERRNVIKIFHNFAIKLADWLKLLNMNPHAVKFIVEQNLIDFEVHLRGTPDLIVEDPINRKALVVEWKTGEKTPSDYEWAQVMAYAILEARRLGYRKEDLEKVILGTLTKEQGISIVKGYSLLPVILRPQKNVKFSIHPALVPVEKVMESYKICRELIERILIEAEHLTILLTNQETLTGIRSEETRVRVKGLRYPVNPLRLTPRILPRGSPKNQRKFPCVTKNGKPICPYHRACKYYFGRDFGSAEDYERIMWGLRYDILEEREKLLAPYKGLYEVFCWLKLTCDDSVNRFIKEVSSGIGFVVNLKFPINILRCKTHDKYGNILKKIIVVREGKELYTGRIDLVSEIKFQNEIIVASRDLDKLEKSDKLGLLPRCIPEGKPVILSLLDSWNPLLSLHIFGRVEKVELCDDKICYCIGFPNIAMKLQKLLLKRYIKRMSQVNALLAEVGVDLTRADLEAIDAIQRWIHEESQSSELGEVVNELRVHETIDELRREIYGEMKGLGKLLRTVISSRRR